MVQLAITLPQVIIDNVGFLIVPNSFEYDEGLGEQSITTLSAGGGAFEAVIADNGETRFSSFKFSFKNTSELIESARALKVSNIPNGHSVQWVNEGITRTFNNAILTNIYTVALAFDGAIDLEWMSASAV